MASHLSDIGFCYEGFPDFDQELEHLIKEALRGGECLKAPEGQYVVWRPGVGAELWVQLDEEQTEVIGYNPHFAGPARVPIRITGTFTSEELPMDGRASGWVAPPGADAEAEGFPLAVDVPNFTLVREALALPLDTTVQLAAFSQGLNCYPDDEAFRHGQRAPERRPAARLRRLLRREPPMPVFSAESVIQPFLRFPGDEESEWYADAPKAEMLSAGHVRQADLLTNPATGRTFWHIQVHTLGITYDVVADPETVTGEPAEGGVVQGHFWLSGRLVELEAG